MSVEEAVDKCIQCGFCLQACPTYRMFETEESSPRGRIARVRDLRSGVVDPSLESLATFGECLGCRACEAACPSGVHYEEILAWGRAQLAKVEPPLPLTVRTLLRVIERPGRLRLAAGGWRRAGTAAVRLARRLRSRRPEPRLVAALPRPAKAPDLTPQPGAEVAVHRGCLMDVLWDRTNARAVLRLRESGNTADLMPREVGCCGALHAHTGDMEVARRLARRVIESFEHSGARHIVSLAGGCGAHLKGYPSLFEGEAGWLPRAQAVAEAVRDVATLLVQAGYEAQPAEHLYTYQDSCHLRNGLKVTREPRLLLEGPGYREMPSAGQCCGSAGVYNMVRPDVAGPILAAKAAEVRGLGVVEVVTANPGCELQWRLGVREGGLPVRVTHLVDHLWEQRHGKDEER